MFEKIFCEFEWPTFFKKRGYQETEHDNVQGVEEEEDEGDGRLGVGDDGVSLDFDVEYDGHDED